MFVLTLLNIPKYRVETSCRPHFYFRHASPWRRLRTRWVLAASEPVAYRLVTIACVFTTMHDNIPFCFTTLVTSVFHS